MVEKLQEYIKSKTGSEQLKETGLWPQTLRNISRMSYEDFMGVEVGTYLAIKEKTGIDVLQELSKENN